MKLDKTLLYRCIGYVIGLFFLAAGVAFSANSGLGISPVNSLPYAVNEVIGIGLGTCVVIVYSCYILIQILLLRKEFHPKNLLQLVFSTIFGYLVDFDKWVLGDFTIPTYFGQLGMLLISIVLVSLGLCFYLAVDLVPMPMEGMQLAIHKKLNGRLTFPTVKILADSGSVVIAVVVTLIGIGRVSGVREGTVIAALVTGKVLAVIQPYIRPRLEAICFPGKAEADSALKKDAGDAFDIAPDEAAT